MERSQSGYIEPMTRGSRANAARVQAVIHAISERFVGEPPILERTDVAQQDFAQHGWRVTPEDMRIPGSELNYE